MDCKFRNVSEVSVLVDVTLQKLFCASLDPDPRGKSWSCK